MSQTVFYICKLDKTKLKQVDSNPCLGLLISQDLNWTQHITNIYKKVNSLLGFLRRNSKHCPTTECKKTAFIALERSQLEYGSVTWDPYLKKDIEKSRKNSRKLEQDLFKMTTEVMRRGM